MNSSSDKFVDMVTARAEVDLRLSDFAPRSMLSVPRHNIARAKFPVIDYHNHLDAQDPENVLRIMDACNVEKVLISICVWLPYLLLSKRVNVTYRHRVPV